MSESNPPDSIPVPQPSTGHTAAQLAQLNGKATHEERVFGLIMPQFEPLTVCRIVNVWSSEWTGPRAGIVTNVDPGTESTINVFLDGREDRGVLMLCRNSPFGNSVHIRGDVAVRETAELASMLRTYKDGHYPLDQHSCKEWGEKAWVSISYPFVPRTTPKLPDFNDEQTTLMAAGIAANCLNQLKPQISDYITKTLAEALSAKLAPPGMSMDQPSSTQEPAPETTSPHEPRPVGQVPEALPDPSPATEATPGEAPPDNGTVGYTTDF